MKKEINQIILDWLNSEDVKQKALADKQEVTTGGISRMLKGDFPVPQDRFLQIVHFLHPPQIEVTEAFGIYLDKLQIPKNAMRLEISHPASTTQTARERVHTMVDQLPDVQVIALEQFLTSILKKEDAGK